MRGLPGESDFPAERPVGPAMPRCRVPRGRCDDAPPAG